ncbi:MAG: hypothetical protein ACLPLZ_02445 [Terracidiphilus sp.]
MGDLGRFIYSAGYFGGGSVIVAVILLAIAVIEHIKGKNVEAKWFFIVACLAFCLGAFMAWKDADNNLQVETHDKSDLQGQIEFLTEPNLSADITTIMAADSARTGNAIMILVVTITNRGAPSTFSIGTDRLIFADGRSVILDEVPPSAAEYTTIRNKGDSPTVVLKGSDRLVPKADAAPIERGGGLTGWAMYIVPGFSKEEATQKGAQVRLEFFDVNGKLFSTQKEIKSKPGDLFSPKQP